MRKQFDKLTKNQEGMVAITVTMVIMIIVTLIVTSFALIVRREQRQSLDRQLSSQAMYAAEAGIEDAKSALSVPVDPLTQDIEECTGPYSFKNVMLGKAASAKRNFEPDLDANVGYSCLLIDHDPVELTETAKGPKSGAFIEYVSAPDIDSIKISWENTNKSRNYDSGSSFPAGGGSLNTAAASITVMPAFGQGSISRDELTSWSHTFFAYPSSDTANPGQVGQISYLNGGGGITSNSAQGQIVSGHCNSGNPQSKFCSVQINGMGRDTPPGTNEDYFVIVKPLYQEADFSFQAISGTTPQPLSGAQAIVDVTGKAADVLRRVRVAVPIGLGAELSTIQGILPNAALETTKEICKQLVNDGTEVKDLCDGSVIKLTEKKVTNNPCTEPPFDAGDFIKGQPDGISIALYYANGGPKMEIDMPISPTRGPCVYNLELTYGDKNHASDESKCNGGDLVACDMWKQPEEEFYAVGLDSAGNEIFHTPTFPDVPNWNSSAITHNQTFTVNNGTRLATIKFFHPPIQNPTGNLAMDANSVHIYSLKITGIRAV